MDEATPQYLKGFNSGYLLAKHEPELFKKIEKSLDSNSDYIQGLQSGKKQHDREKLLEQIKQSQQTKNNELKKGL